MTPLSRVAFIGTHLPRHCGIATFTHDLRRAVATARPQLHTSVVAMTDPGQAYDYPASVRFEIHDDTFADYVQAAAFLNGEWDDVVSLQHEYGIFGGSAGRDIIELISRLCVPLVTTLHTVLAEPDAAQHSVMDKIIAASDKIVVMSQKGKDLLRSVHDVHARKIHVIPHGVPEFPFVESQQAKAKLGFAGRMVILTFGLLSPNKGIETVIDAMPQIISSCPNAVYLILGATHPNVMRDHGETYRESLVTRARELEVDSHVVFFNQFVDQATLLDFISMCDVYVTPYLNEAQMTSGTLAYSVALGKAVVSTPYWHASELLHDGGGILVPFRDSKAIGREVASLLANDALRHSLCKCAYETSRSMTWPQTARRYLDVFDAAREESASDRIAISTARWKDGIVSDLRTDYFLSLCDSTGLLQHAVHAVPNRAHGYCVDDNARALLLSCALSVAGESQFTDTMTNRFAAFIQHAWNPDIGRFRNFMSYDRQWLEETGSEDSHGRTLWALGICSSNDASSSRQAWAAALFTIALSKVEGFTSPRAWAFTLLGLNAYCSVVEHDRAANRLREYLAGRLMAVFAATQTSDWIWFEEMLAYDNARLPQALIQTGLSIGQPPLVKAGLASLRWLMALQAAPIGHFRPVGTESFGKIRKSPGVFDQQPVEAAAAISACLVAWKADRGSEWVTSARGAFDWFFGCNDLNRTLVDPQVGSCADGLHRDRANENRGAESTLAYLLSRLEIMELERALATDPPGHELYHANGVSRRLMARRIPGEITCLSQDS